MEAQLKKAQLAQQSADLATTQAMEATEASREKAQLAQQSADLATTQRSAMEAQLKKPRKPNWPSRAQILPQRSVARWKPS